MLDVSSKYTKIKVVHPGVVATAELVGNINPDARTEKAFY